VQHSLYLWIGFTVFVIIMLLIDLMVFNRKPHKITIKESLIWTGIWIALSCVFGAGVYWFMGGEIATDYFAGYLIEKSLSMDNIFVFILIFNYFSVPPKYQHEVLFWGIFGALVFRFLFIFAGAALLEQFHWVVYIFGVFLIYTAYKLAVETNKEVNPEDNPIVKWTRKYFSVSDEYHEDHFFIRHKGKLMATPLFIVLVMVETTDIVFALDSVPAILAITTDEFIVFSSNAFAILGLRALYFALDGVMNKFRHLHYGLAAILGFVGIKFLISNWYHIPTYITLIFIILAFAVSIAASLMIPDDEEPAPEQQNV
jgi:tellurite resistance protein TerC